MSAEDFTPPKYLADMLAWESEFPPQLTEDVDPLHVLIRTELNEADQNFERLCDQFKRLDMLPTASVFHSYGTTDGFVSVASNRVPTSAQYRWKSCLNLTVNYRSNELFGTQPKQHVRVEDYFIDYEKNLLAVSHGRVTIGREFKLPPNTPSVIWKDTTGTLYLYSGEGYKLAPPDYNKVLEYDDARSLRDTTMRLVSLLAGLTEATLDARR